MVATADPPGEGQPSAYAVPMSFPDDLRPLFRGAETREHRLSVNLPPGRVVYRDGTAVLWLSDGPAPAGLWSRLRTEHAGSGLWPLLVSGLSSDASRPWETADLAPGRMSPAAMHDPAQLLAGWWRRLMQPWDGRSGLSEEQRAAIAPYGQEWPGLTHASGHTTDPDAAADALAGFVESAEPDDPSPFIASIEEMIRAAGLPPSAHDQMSGLLAGVADAMSARVRIALVPAERGADALAAAGWQGAGNHIGDTGELGAVLRHWEDARGARVVAAGFDDIRLSVAAPPQTVDEALRVAAEHFAFCPDNVLQESEPPTLAVYADQLVGASSWTFWWD